MISTNDMRPGQAIIFEGRICLITQYDRVKPGKGPTFVRVMLKDITTGQSLDKTWRGEQKVELAILETRPHQYLYRQGDKFHFMDMETYDQVELGPEQVPQGDRAVPQGKHGGQSSPSTTRRRSRSRCRPS